jgi:GT2 family glycosyltransferase
MERNIKASVVIPTYRRPRLLANALKSLAAQKSNYAFEVVVVNDAPDEDLSALATEFGDIGLRLITPGRNVGRGIARNLGVTNSSGGIIIFLDDDMTVAQGFIDAHVESHREPDLAVVGNIKSAPEYARDPLARFIERQGAKKRIGVENLPARCFRTGNGSLSRALFSKVGMFDESFDTYGEDMDLAMRLDTHGARFVFAEDAVSYNHHPPDLDDMLEKLREYGRYTLPILSEKQPELARSTWVHLAHPVKFGEESLGVSLRKLGLRLALLPPFYALARRLYRLSFLGRLLFPVIDYLRLHSYIGAYREALRSRR